MTNKKEFYDKCPEIDYFMNEEESDVVFVVDGQRLSAHKLILSYKSFYFRAMFSGNFIEGKNKEVVIEDTTFEAFQTLIQFLYCDHIIDFKDYNDFQLIGEVLKLCDKYLLSRLMEKIVKHLKSCIAFENVVSIMKIAIDSENDELVENARNFINRMTRDELIKLAEVDTNELIRVWTSGSWTHVFLWNHWNICSKSS